MHGLSVKLTPFVLLPCVPSSACFAGPICPITFEVESSYDVSPKDTVQIRLDTSAPTGTHTGSGSGSAYAVAAIRQSRSLQEPVGRTPAEAQHLDHLRSLTTSLGGEWLANGRRFLPADLLQVTDIDPDTALGSTEHLQSIGVAILKVDYAPELLTIRVALPATPAEVEAATQVMRGPNYRRCFPALLPVLPQPSFGAVCYLAAPEWAPGLQGVCIDTVALDGRLFASLAPEYVTRHELLTLAGVATFPDISVWVGPGPELLADEGHIHIFPGMLISFRLADQEHEALYSLGQLLLFLDGWAETPEWPEPHFGTANLLVHCGRTSLFSVNPPEPTRYRELIGEATGAEPHRMRLFAATSQSNDAALNGVLCRTVIAVSHPPNTRHAGVWHSILIDCWPLHEGWIELALNHGILDANELVTVLNDSAPPGWYANIDVETDHTGCLYLPPGHVVHASYAEREQTFPVASGTSEAQADANAQNALPIGEDPDTDPSDGRPSADGDDGDLQADQVIGDDVTSITRYIFAPEFIPVEVGVPIRLPTAPAEFIATAQRHRNGETWPFFPQLCEVKPQPVSTFVCLLAVPTWPATGVPVLIQLLGEAPRTFATFGPALISHDGALNLAGTGGQWGYRVFVRDIPWPIPEEGTTPVEPGDLITIVQPDRHAPGMALADMLQWTYGWFQPDGPPGHWPGGTWLLSDEKDVHAFLTMPSGRLSARIAAEALSVDPNELVFASSVPPIPDHARAGRTSEGVCIAVIPAEHPRPEDILYVLDLRPVLLPIRVMRAPAGRVDIAFLCACTAHRCPVGYCITVKGGTATPGHENHYRLVGFGDVLSIEFRARREPTSATGSAEPAHGLHSLPDSTTSSDTRNTATSSGSTTADAGTGGSTRVHANRQHTTDFRMTCPFDVGLPFPARLDQHFGASTPDCMTSVRPSSLALRFTLEVKQRWNAHFDKARCNPWTPTSLPLNDHCATHALLGLLIALLHCAALCHCTRTFALHLFCFLGVCSLPLQRRGLWLLIAGLLLLPGVYAGPASFEKHPAGLSQTWSLQAAIHDAGMRPVATPCRGLHALRHHSLPSRDGIFGIADAPPPTLVSDVTTIQTPSPNLTRFAAFPTLLEESVARPDSEAYMLAATLLETLFEHFADKPPTQAQRHVPCKISLQDCLPPPTFNLSLDSVSLPHDRGLLDKLFRAWPRTWLLPAEWDDVLLPASTSSALKSLTPWSELFQPHRLADLSFSLYTDGSANPALGNSGFAVAILAHVDGDSALLGLLGDQILGNEDTPWLPEGPPALHAEHIALAVAVLWSLQLRTVMQYVSCSLYFDCTAAGWSAAGTWQTSGPTSEKVHHLCTVAKAMPGIHLQFHHVKGHSENPWNDLADHVAKTAASRSRAWPKPPHDICQEVMTNDISWLAPELDARLHHAVPIIDGAITWSDPVQATSLLAPSQLVPRTGEQLAQGTRFEEFSLHAVTINIQSLRAKCQYVEDQLDQRSVQVAFFQETKLPGGTHTSKNYLRLHTDAGCWHLDPQKAGPICNWRQRLHH